MRNKIIFALVIAGVIAALISAYLYSRKSPPPPPVFNPPPNPYVRGVYANGIIESYQAHGQNVNLFPEVAGVVTRVYVAEGQTVKRGDPLISLDASVQRATTEQLRAQAESAHALLEQLQAQPRAEVLAVSKAQVDQAAANLRTTRTTYEKQATAFKIDSRAVSKDTLDTAANNAKASLTSLEVAQRQYELTKAGAWIYDIRNQEKTYEMQHRAYLAADALLQKYEIRAPKDGKVLSIQFSVGSYVSPTGVYDSYTQQYLPLLVMGDTEILAVRCYVDEVLIPRLPAPSKLTATMFVRGTNTSIPLTFERVQPYVSPKIQLSNERTERVDLRVLPIIFRFTPPEGMSLYQGQLVDVYLGESAPSQPPATEGPPVSRRPAASGPQHAPPTPSGGPPGPPGNAGTRGAAP